MLKVSWFRLDQDLIQDGGLSWQFALAGWKTIRAQQVSDQINALTAAQFTRPIGWHRFAGLFDETANGLAIPFIEEIPIDERGRIFTTKQSFPMAACAFGIVSGLPSASLLFRINAIPYRTRCGHRRPH